METETLFTRADYLRLPEGFPAQWIEGCLVKYATPVYGHQRVIGELLRRLMTCVPEGRVLHGPLEVSIDDHNSYHPDVAVFREPPPSEESGTRMPLVVFEVLSPETEGYDRDTKRERYLNAGVAEVWLVDRENQTIEVHSLDGVRTARGPESLASTAIPGFSLSPAALFAPPR